MGQCVNQRCCRRAVNHNRIQAQTPCVGFDSREQPPVTSEPTPSADPAASALDRGDFDRLRTFGSPSNLESDSLIFLQPTNSAPTNRRVVDEHICSAAVGRDKAKALLAVEPFDGSFCHISSLSDPADLTHRSPPLGREPVRSLGDEVFGIDEHQLASVQHDRPPACRIDDGGVPAAVQKCLT